jgi:hypothetical protein
MIGSEKGCFVESVHTIVGTRMKQTERRGPHAHTKVGPKTA